jgi:O-antigen/teichoic acid export membrane protein
LFSRDPPTSLLLCPFPFQTETPRVPGNSPEKRTVLIAKKSPQIGSDPSFSTEPHQFFGDSDDKGCIRKLIDTSAKAGLAILDQGMISGSNFLIGILLARWLMPDQYGAYALAFAVFLLLALLYQCLLLEPMTVFGGSSYRSCRREYLGILIRMHLFLGCIIVVGLGASALLARGLGRSTTLAGALAGVTVAAPCVLLFWLARRSVYLEASPAEAVKGAFLYCGLVLGGLYLVYRFGVLSPLSAFLLMAGGALVSSAALFARLRSLLPEGAAAPPLLDIWHRHWRYGRWALGCSIAGWIPAYVYYPVLSRFSGMAHAGELRALMNLVAPVEQTLGGLSLLFLPYAAHIQEQFGTVRAASLAKRITVLSVAATAVYWAFVIPLRVPIFHMMYSYKYTSISYLVPWVALGSLLWSAGYGSGIILRAMEYPKLVFIALGTSSVVTLLVGIPATFFFGLWGAVVWGLVSSNGVALLLVVYLLRRKLKALSVSQTFTANHSPATDAVETYVAD